MQFPGRLQLQKSSHADNSILMPNNHTVTIEDKENGVYEVHVAVMISATVKLIVNLDKNLPQYAGELPPTTLVFVKIKLREGVWILVAHDAIQSRQIQLFVQVKPTITISRTHTTTTSFSSTPLSPHSHPHHYLIMTATRNLIQYYTYRSPNEFLESRMLSNKFQQ